MHHDRDPEAINAHTRPEIGYEHRDISVKGIAVSTIHFFVWSTVIIALTYVGFVMMIDLPVRPTDPPKTIPAYPNPLLQGTEQVAVDIAELKRAEDEQLSTYGWVDQEKGVARIPIDRAIDEVAEKGLGATPPAEAAGETRL
jgi:hypothetical protein